MAANKILLEKQREIDDTDYGAPEVFDFDPVEHVYTLGGKRLYGVTTILGVIAKPMLIQWAANQAINYVEEHIDKYGLWRLEGKTWVQMMKEARTVHKKKKEKAGEQGTEVHAEVEKWIKGCIEINEGLPVIVEDPKRNKQVQNFMDWAVKHKVKFLASEKRMYSRTWWTAGTADIVCEIEGRLYVGDVKTSSGIYPEAFIQASAYSKMLVEMGEFEKFGGVVIINLKKDGGFDFKFNYDLEGNIKAFEAASILYKHLNAISGK